MLKRGGVACRCVVVPRDDVCFGGEFLDGFKRVGCPTPRRLAEAIEELAAKTGWLLGNCLLSNFGNAFCFPT